MRLLVDKRTETGKQPRLRYAARDANMRIHSSIHQLILRFRESSVLTAVSLAGYKKLTESLFASAGSLIPGVIACLLTAWLCWRANGDQVFAVITAVIALIGLLRIVLLYAYRRHDAARDGWKETRRWNLAYTTSATFLSALMGLNGFFSLGHPENSSVHILVVAVNIGLGSTYIARNAARPVYALMQLFLFLAPLAGSLIVQNDIIYSALGWLLILYIIVNISVVFNIYRNIVDVVRAKKTSDWLAAELRHQNGNLGMTLNTMPHGAAMFDKEMNLIVANDRHYELFCLPPVQDQTCVSMQRHLLQTGFISDESLQLFGQAYERCLAERSETKTEIITQRGSHLIIYFHPSPNGGILLFTEDATARKNAEAEVQRLARYDTLTGLPNRREFNVRLDQAFDHLRNGGPIFALLYVDLDGFKQVNDTLGHAMGDALLIEVSNRLTRKKISRAQFFRLGGDEFAAICFADRDEAMDLAGVLCAALKEPFATKTHESRIGASIGVAFAPEHGANAEELLRKADIALYRAKANGRGLAVVYDVAIEEELTERIQLEADLADVLSKGFFDFHFQPIVDVESGRVVSYEMLARWKHPERGYVSPDVFIPIAEQTGGIHQLGCIAIREACAFAAMLHRDISVSVNVSVLQFRDPALLFECVTRSLEMHKLEPHRLTLEITESLLIDEFEHTVETIQKIKALGVQFSLDDFGSGYSSLSLLTRLPLSIVKIDRSLTQDIATCSASYAVVDAICALARNIGLIVVAEGVEKREQQLALRLTGADRAQGWLFGKPAPLAESVLEVGPAPGVRVA